MDSSRHSTLTTCRRVLPFLHVTLLNVYDLAQACPGPRFSFFFSLSRGVLIKQLHYHIAPSMHVRFLFLFVTPIHLEKPMLDFKERK